MGYPLRVVPAGRSVNPFTLPVVAITPVQRRLADLVLGVVSSDSQFKEKALNAFAAIFSASGIPIPTLANLSPPSIAGGTGPTNLFLTGTDFTNQSVIYLNGNPVTTQFNTPNNIQTSIDLTDTVGPAQIAVCVITGPLVTNTVFLSVT